MKKQIKDLKRRTLHNADAAYYVLDYLANGFPTQLFEPFTDEEGNLLSRPVVVDGQPVQSREAVEIRDRLIEKLASLAARADCARSNPASLRYGAGGRGHRPQSAHREERLPTVRRGSRSRPGSAPRTSPRRKASWTTRSGSGVLRCRRYRTLLSRRSLGAEPEKARPLSARSRDGRPIPPFRALAAPTAPIRRSRRCSGPSPPM